MKLNKAKFGSHYEVLFATILDAFGVDYVCQVSFWDYWLEHHGVSRFSVDFVLHDRGLIFEIDGESHTGWRQRRIDRLKDEFLLSHNLRVIRIRNAELETDYEAVASRIYELVYDENQLSRVPGRTKKQKRQHRRPRPSA